MPFTTLPDVHLLRDRFVASPHIDDTLSRDQKNHVFKTLVHASGNDLTTILSLPHVSLANHEGDSFDNVTLFKTKTEALAHIDEQVNGLRDLNVFVEQDITFDGFIVRPYGYEEPTKDGSTVAPSAVYSVAIWTAFEDNA